jgi:plastocyanin
MTGTIEVVAANSTGITTQATVDQYAARHMASEHDQQVAIITSTRNVPGVSDGPDGTQVWTVRAGTDWHNGHLDVIAFLPSTLTIRQGDTVVWYVDHNAPHTVSFRGDDGVSVDFIQLQLPNGTILTSEQMMQQGPPPPPTGPGDPSQMPRLVVGPGAMPYKASPTHNGHSTYNSGLFGLHLNEPVVPGAPSTWALAFDVPGTYRYLCTLHEALGMEGTVTVLPR